MSEKYIVTWDMLQIHARKLAERLLPADQWKGIIAVSRGGWFLPPYWHVNCASAMSIPSVSPVTIMTISVK